MDRRRLSNPLDMLERERVADEQLEELVKKLMGGDDSRELVDVEVGEEVSVGEREAGQG